VKTTNVLSIDASILQEISKNGAIIYGVYASTMHVMVNKKIITIGHHVGHGKHHMVIEDQISFNTIDFKVGDVFIYRHEGVISHPLFDMKIDESKIKAYDPYVMTYRMNSASYQTFKELKAYVETHHAENFYRYQKDNPWLKFQFDQIGVFLAAPGLPSGLSILGLGMGLTPLGDDILTGFILGLNTVGKTLPWIESLVSEAQKKTSKLSAQNLEDTFLRLYPEIFIQMIEDLFIHNNIEGAKSILKLGSTSGAGILTGFICGCM
jgi:hypothetical protein